MFFSSTVHCTVMVLVIYLTVLLITKKIIKYRLQQFTSVMKSETITLVIWNRSAVTQALNIITEIILPNILTCSIHGDSCVCARARTHVCMYVYMCVCIYIYIHMGMRTIILLQYHDTILMKQTVWNSGLHQFISRFKKENFFITGTFWTNEWLPPLIEELYPRVFSPDPLCTGMVQTQGGQLAGLSSVTLSSWCWLQ